jgi:hypothetical protein
VLYILRQNLCDPTIYYFMNLRKNSVLFLFNLNNNLGYENMTKFDRSINVTPVGSDSARVNALPDGPHFSYTRDKFLNRVHENALIF